MLKNLKSLFFSPPKIFQIIFLYLAFCITIELSLRRTLVLYIFTQHFTVVIMALGKKINSIFTSNNDTGFGTSATSFGGRFINKDGSFNLRKEGLPFWDKLSLFHTAL